MTLATETAPPPTAAELLARARALVPTLRARAEATEAARQVLPETVAELRASGLHRIGVPNRWGGIEAGFDVLIEAGYELARGCAASAWCLSLWGAHAFLTGHFPVATQAAIYAGGPLTLVSTSFMPNGVLTPTPGGYRLSGRWEFSSGCDHADWLLLGAIADGVPVWVAVPRRDWQIVDTWFVSGLSGTGSKDIVVADVAVATDQLLRDPYRAPGVTDRTGWQIHRHINYAVPIRCLLGWELVTVVVGIAQGMIDEFVRRTSGKTGGTKTADVPAVERRLAEATAEVDGARRLLLSDVREALALAARGATVTEAHYTRYQRDKGFVVGLALAAGNRIFELCGAHSLYLRDPLQRMHRDLIAAARRDGFIFDIGGVPYGRLLAQGAIGPSATSG